MISAGLADIQESFQHSDSTEKYCSVSVKIKNIKSKGQSVKKEFEGPSL